MPVALVLFIIATVLAAVASIGVVSKPHLGWLAVAVLSLAFVFTQTGS